MTNNPTNDFGSIFRNTTPATNGGNVSSINGVGHNHESNNSDSTDGNVIPTLFKSPIRSKISLLKLTIDGIVLNSSDSSLLIRCLNLGELQTLSLLDVSEVMKEARFETGLPQLSAETQIEMFDGIDPEEAENIRMESLVPHRIYEKDSFFLVKIAPYLTSLKELNIDHYNDHCDFTPHLISEVSGLQKLYCRLRWNRTKEVFGNEGWNHLTLKYMQAIGGHNESLQHLIIDTLNESNGNVSPIFQNGHETKLDDGEVKAIPSFAFRQYLPQMRQLRSLRLPVSQKHILSLMESVAELTQLEYLEVILVEYSTMQDNFNRGTGQYGGARTGPGPHLGTLLSPSTSSQCLQLTDSETVNLRDAKKILDPQNLMPQNISLNKVLQIAKLFKMYIGERSHNEGPLGTSKNQLRYIKCFNIIVDVWDIHNLQVKERGLDDWFSDKLRGL
ncbi:unnamed protein product [Kuraishia capsulata CBS 1993]|uniref:Uncharacterized protein n=1 Tax=Kuraishia capsulata CBS 1993 TaxID=1382522 RepID=W6MRV5_9ASCO|nr:uncharacterized protein KUCA_T00000516001 [Kuraishia capsulata CBS 1993]CDK24550.1 unnamed protein product [Kuraishia capsulata CBS 1993]